MLRAVVMGPPVPYGSKRAFVVKGRAVLVNQNHRNLRDFQDAMRKAMMGGTEVQEITGYFAPGQAVRICVSYYLTRPKSHFCKRGLSGNGLHSPFPTRKPDCDKVLRAVADCGTGIWYSDDSQVVEMIARKWWADDGPERTEVTCEAVTA